MEHFLRAGLGQPGFQDVRREALVHAQATVAALVSASLVLLPVVALFIPGLATSVDEFLFVLFRLLALVLGSLLVHIVLAVSKDLAEALDGMLIDQLVIVIQGFLPFLLFAVVQGLGTFPGCQCCFSLPAP